MVIISWSSTIFSWSSCPNDHGHHSVDDDHGHHLQKCSWSLTLQKHWENTGENDDHMMTMVIILKMMTMQLLMMSMVIK